MNVKQIRENLKLTQKDFANLIGKSVASLKNYESGKTKPSKDVMVKIKELVEGVADAATVAEIEVKKTVHKGGRKAKEVAEDPAVKAEDAADVITANEIEAKKTVRKGSQKAKKVAEAAAKKANEVIEPVKEAAEPVVARAKDATKKVTRKEPKKAEAKATPEVTIEAQMGGQITVDDILKRVPEGVENVYIKPEENKAYWVKGDESGDINLW